MHDFKQATLYSGDLDKAHKKLASQDKGQKAMLKAWLTCLKEGKPCVSYECLMTNSLATVLAVESLIIGQPLKVDMAILASPSQS